VSFYETGTKGDKVAGQVGNNYPGDGVELIGYELKPWQAYGMPEPHCDDDKWSVNSHVTSGQKCGAQSDGGRRWGQCDQWRSSCNKKFQGYLTTAGGLVDAVKTAASSKPGDASHVSPCTFGDLYADAMYYINQCVGSDDPITGLSVPPPDAPAYIPRWASWIFGGGPGRSSWPNFTDPWVADDSENTPGWWSTGGVKEYNSEWRNKVGDGEFCRQVITADYPCKGATSYPGMCGGCVTENLVGVCTNYLCSHYPLTYWQREFSALREELLNSVLIYEGKNKDELQGKSVDEACADQVVEANLAAPDIDPAAVDENQAAYAATVQAEQDKIAAQALLQQTLAGGTEEEPQLPIGLIAGGLAAVGLAIWLGRRRR
jgi:hypothetical protein